MRGRWTSEEVLQAYKQTGSVWKAAKLLGGCGQSVHERLLALGVKLPGRAWTREELDEIRALAGTCTIGEIARRLGRPYNGVALKLSRIGVAGRSPAKPKLPRGAGYDKASVLKHIKALESWPKKYTQYCRSHSVDVEVLAQAIQRVDLAWWEAYVASHSDLPQKQCTYCGRTFVPSSGKQEYCTRQCGSTARADRQYFAGNRRNTIGLAEQTCQLCGRVGVKGLSSHHVIGKEADPNGEILIALCPGCHQIISHLGGRTFVDEPVGWENLINLVMLRRQGLKEGKAIWTYVEIEWQDIEEDEE